MILFIRRHFHKNLIQGMALVMALSFVGIGSLTQIVHIFLSDSTSLMSINGRSISKQEFALRANAEKQIIGFYQQQLGDMAAQFLAQVGLSLSPEKNAYNKLLQELVLSECAHRSGLVVSTQSIARKAQDPMAVMNIFGTALPRSMYDRSGRLQQEILSPLLARAGLSIEQFETQLEEQVERELMRDVISLATPITQKEIDAWAVKKYGKRHYTVTLYTLAPYLEKVRKQEVTADTLKEFFEEQNKQGHRYWSPEKRAGVMWKMAIGTQDKDQLEQEARKAISADAQDFEAFIAKHKAFKTILKQQEQKYDSQQSQMLFRLPQDNKGTFIEGNALSIVMPTTIEASLERPYGVVEKRVSDDYYTMLANRELVADLDGAGVPDAHKTGTYTVTLNGEEATAKTTESLLRKDEVSVDRVENMVIPGSTLKGLRKNGAYKVTLDTVERKEALTPTEYATLRSAIRQSNERVVAASLVDSLIKTAKIKTTKDLNEL